MNHLPKRGDGVEAWLKEKRDEYTEPQGTDSCCESSAWTALNDVLERYRELADTGAVLEGSE